VTQEKKTNHCTATGACLEDSDGCYHRKYSPGMGACLFGIRESKKCISPFALKEARDAQDNEIVDAVFNFCAPDGSCTADAAQEKLCAHNPQVALKALCPERAWCDVCCSADARRAVRNVSQVAAGAVQAAEATA